MPEFDLKLISEFPFDIVTEIFSHIDQRDCMTFSMVCREWYKLLPKYTKSVWKTVRFTPRYLHNNWSRLEQGFLGDHVKHVTLQDFTEEEELTVMIVYLVVFWKCNSIETLVLDHCTITNRPNRQKAFIGLLKNKLSQITHLTLDHHYYDLDILPIIDACPNLTHFSYNPYRPQLLLPLDKDPKEAKRNQTPRRQLWGVNCKALVTLLQKNTTLTKIALYGVSVPETVSIPSCILALHDTLKDLGIHSWTLDHANQRRVGFRNRLAVPQGENNPPVVIERVSFWIEEDLTIERKESSSIVQ